MTPEKRGTSNGMADRPRSVEFFEQQFRRQVREKDFALNPFETLALPHLSGDVLDLGCGLGNLTLEAARRGCRVTAVDASPAGISRIREAIEEEALTVEAVVADLESYAIDRTYDTIVAIGLLMFFRRARAYGLLEQIQAHVRPGGRAVVNVLVKGTTFLDMFEPGNYYLFGREELRNRFAEWKVLAWHPEVYPAPRDTVKKFTTLIAEKSVADCGRE